MGTTHKRGYYAVICVNCGLCCYDYVVVVIKKEFINFEGEDANDLPQEAFVIKSGNEPCPYLKWEGNNSKCEVHDKPWYPSTPCHDFGQIEEHPNTICRLGAYVKKKIEEGDIRYNYRLKCQTFVKPKSPQEIIDGPIFGKEQSTEG